MLWILLSLSLAAPTCFIDEMYSPDQVQVMKDVQYGSAFNNATGKVEVLLLDAYIPPRSNTARPGVVLVHGGGFSHGDKEEMEDVAIWMATRGFVTVSINYRLTASFWPYETEKPILDAVEDVRASVRFMRRKAKELLIDENRILLSGASAGAFASLYLAYAKIAQYEGNSGNAGFSSQVSAILSISGALQIQSGCEIIHPVPTNCSVDLPINHIDDIVGHGQPSMIVFHGTEDHEVPYVNGLKCYKQAQKVGLPSVMYACQGAGHLNIWDYMISNATGPSKFQQSMFQVFSYLDLAHAQFPKNCSPRIDWEG